MLTGFYLMERMTYQNYFKDGIIYLKNYDSNPCFYLYNHLIKLKENKYTSE